MVRAPALSLDAYDEKFMSTASVAIEQLNNAISKARLALTVVRDACTKSGTSKTMRCHKHGVGCFCNEINYLVISFYLINSVSHKKSQKAMYIEICL